MRYYSNYEAVVARIDPQQFVKWLEGRGFSHVPRKRTDVWHGCREKGGRFWIDVPLDRTLADYTDAMVRALGVAAEAEDMCIFEMLTVLVPCRTYIDMDMFVSALGSCGSFSREDLIRIVDSCVTKYEFDDWNPWPVVAPPENTKLRVTLECIAGSRKVRDAVYLAGEPVAPTRFEYEGPGWYMSLTGKRIDDSRVRAWKTEIPYRGNEK